MYVTFRYSIAVLMCQMLFENKLWITFIKIACQLEVKLLFKVTSQLIQQDICLLHVNASPRAFIYNCMVVIELFLFCIIIVFTGGKVIDLQVD